MTKRVGGLSQGFKDLSLRIWGGSGDFLLSRHYKTLPGQGRLSKNNENQKELETGFSAISITFLK